MAVRAHFCAKGRMFSNGRLRILLSFRISTPEWNSPSTACNRATRAASASISYPPRRIGLSRIHAELGSVTQLSDLIGCSEPIVHIGLGIAQSLIPTESRPSHATLLVAV